VLLMEIWITEWALSSYLKLKCENVFDDRVYKEIIRPDVIRILAYPNDLKFSQPKFWSIAQGESGGMIPNGYKMKWHQVGSGRVQLRLTVGMFEKICFLCEAYVKRDQKFEKRMLARFKDHLRNISRGHYCIRGKLK